MVYDVYKNFVSPTHTQRPACVLDIRLSPDRVDVNVTPDKRTVFFHEEAAICRFLQDCLVAVWEGERGKYTVDTVLGGIRDGRVGSQVEFSQAVTSAPMQTEHVGFELDRRAPARFPSALTLSLTRASRSFVRSPARAANVDRIWRGPRADAALGAGYGARTGRQGRRSDRSDFCAEEGGRRVWWSRRSWRS